MVVVVRRSQRIVVRCLPLISLISARSGGRTKKVSLNSLSSRYLIAVSSNYFPSTLSLIARSDRLTSMTLTSFEKLLGSALS
jgi:hypothetical protein